MKKAFKQLSNPFSTGGGGPIFETHVQAAFAALMLTKGVAPCLPTWPIFKVKLQGRHLEFNTDDVIVFVRDDSSGREAKLIAQIKHAPSITKGDPNFKDVIHSAWADFVNEQVFRYDTDAIALITGPLSATDTYDVRDLLEWARHSENSASFFSNVQQANFSNKNKRAKLDVFRFHLKNANNGTAPDEETTWQFLRSFHLLGFDLDIKSSVIVALMQSLIGIASGDDVEKIWLKVVSEVQSRNKTAGVLTFESLPQDLLDCFRVKRAPPHPIMMATPIRETIVAALLGGWDENASGDQLLIERLAELPFASWKERIREFWVASSGIIEQKNGKWRVVDRSALWETEGPRMSDAQLDQFKDFAVSVLREKDPALELAPDDRFAASLHGKERMYSSNIRKGVAETLALLGSKSISLTTCYDGKSEGTAFKAVAEILEGGDWNLWASLNDVLPLLAEASPAAFLERVENASVCSESPFRDVFAQEEGGAMGRTYITGLLWGLESLAWAEVHLITVCRILANIAALDPGGNWTNRPSNSLTTILLPWFPQTTANTDKRHAAVRVVAKEQEEVGWKLVFSLLPERHTSTSGSHKPLWRRFIPETWQDGVQETQYWEDIFAYSQLALEMAGSVPARLVQLVGRYFRLPLEIQDKLRQRLNSQEVAALPESERFQIWTALTKLTTNHRKFADNDNWKVPEGSLEKLDEIADRLRPTAPEVRHKRLFGGTDSDQFDHKGDWDEQQKQLERRRQEAVEEIVEKGGVELLFKFATEVEESWRLGFVYGSLSDFAQDEAVLPSLLQSDSKSLLQFVGGYVWGRHKAEGWDWVDSVTHAGWTPQQKGQFFSFLPFREETWSRVETAMGADESEYWRKTSANAYESTTGTEEGLAKLITHGRADAAIHCMHMLIQRDKTIPSYLAIRALDSLTSDNRIDDFEIGELFGYLQRDPIVDPNKLGRLEWDFLMLLGDFRSGSPASLYRRMSDDPNFFCEVIRTVYRSKKDDKKVEPSDEIKARASKAYHLLYDWRLAPGMQKNHSFNHELLQEWFRDVKEQCIDSGHWEVAANQIGQVLFYTPRGEDGLWIDPVCEILDERDHEELRNGILVEIFNSRGGFSYSHGKDELALSEKWEALASKAEIKSFSRLGQTLRKVSERYRRDAEREAKNSPFDSD